MKNIYFILFLTVSVINAQEISVKKQIALDVSINSKLNRFIFDTGAPTLIFDIDLEVDTKIKIYLSDANGQIDTFYFPKKRVKIAVSSFDIETKSKRSIIVSSKKPKFFEEEGISGIFGNNYIFNYDWFYDGISNNISIINDKSKIKRDDYFEIQLIDNSSINCSFKTDNNSFITEKFVLDTGYIGFLSTKKTSDFNKYILGISKKVSLVKSEIDSVLIIKVDFSMGGIILKNAPMVVNNNVGSLNLLGIEFLKCFGDVYFLYSENKLLLKKKDSIEFNFYNPIYFSNEIFGYLVNNKNSFYEEITLKKWDINQKIEPSKIEFQKFNFPITIITIN